MLKELNKIINNFALNNRVFSNEAQFQHELAIELKKLGYEVYLELLSINADDFDEFKQKAKSDRIKGLHRYRC